MAAVALLKFEQSSPSAIVGDGKALVVAANNAVSIKNSTEGGGSNIASWRIELLYGVPSSPDEVDPGVPTLLGENPSSDTPLQLFTPTSGFYGCYRIKITVWDGASYTGQSSVDIRNIAVATPNFNFILPPYQELPKPLALPEDDPVDGRENELNFEMPSTSGQPWGWSGDHDSTHRLWNAALLQMDSVLSGGVSIDWQESVLENDQNDPSGKEVSGARYLIPAAPAAIGAWAGKENYITEYNGAAWVFIAPDIGMTVYVEDIKKTYTWNGTSWVISGSGAGLVGPTTPTQDDQVCFANSGNQDYTAGITVRNVGGLEDGLNLTDLVATGYIQSGTGTPFPTSGQIRVGEDWSIEGRHSASIDFTVLSVDDAGKIEVGGDTSSTGIDLRTAGGITLQAVTGSFDVSLQATGDVNAFVGANKVLDLTSTTATLGHDTGVTSIDYRAAASADTHQFYANGNLVATFDDGGSPRLLFPNTDDAHIEMAAVTSGTGKSLTIQAGGSSGTDGADAGDLFLRGAPGTNIASGVPGRGGDVKLIGGDGGDGTQGGPDGSVEIWAPAGFGNPDYRLLHVGGGWQPNRLYIDKDVGVKFYIQYEPVVTGKGQDLEVAAQDTEDATLSGGQLIFRGGDGNGGGHGGGVTVRGGSGPRTLQANSATFRGCDNTGTGQGGDAIQWGGTGNIGGGGDAILRGGSSSGGTPGICRFEGGTADIAIMDVLALNWGRLQFASGLDGIVEADENLFYKVGASDAHVFEVNSSEVARFDDQGSSRLLFPNTDDAHIEMAAVTSGVGRDLTISGGDAGGVADNAGGAVIIRGGDGSADAPGEGGIGGPVKLVGGSGGTGTESAEDGHVEIWSDVTKSAFFSLGSLYFDEALGTAKVKFQDAVSGAGGIFNVEGQAAASGIGGPVFVRGGQGGSGFRGGQLNLWAGTSTGSPTTGADVSIQAGAGTTGGKILLVSGNGATKGAIEARPGNVLCATFDFNASSKPRLLFASGVQGVVESDLTLNLVSSDSMILETGAGDEIVFKPEGVVSHSMGSGYLTLGSDSGSTAHSGTLRVKSTFDMKVRNTFVGGGPSDHTLLYVDTQQVNTHFTVGSLDTDLIMWLKGGSTGTGSDSPVQIETQSGIAMYFRDDYTISQRMIQSGAISDPMLRSQGGSGGTKLGDARIEGKLNAGAGDGGDLVLQGGEAQGAGDHGGVRLRAYTTEVVNVQPGSVKLVSANLDLNSGNSIMDGTNKVARLFGGFLTLGHDTGGLPTILDGTGSVRLHVGGIEQVNIGSGAIILDPPILEFDPATVAPKITQLTTAQPGEDLTIEAQHSDGVGGQGGDLILRAGAGENVTGGQPGAIQLQTTEGVGGTTYRSVLRLSAGVMYLSEHSATPRSVTFSTDQINANTVASGAGTDFDIRGVNAAVGSAAKGGDLTLHSGAEDGGAGHGAVSFYAATTLLAEFNDDGSGGLPALEWPSSGVYLVPDMTAHLFYVGGATSARVSNDGDGRFLSVGSGTVAATGAVRLENNRGVHARYTTANLLLVKATAAGLIEMGDANTQGFDFKTGANKSFSFTNSATLRAVINQSGLYVGDPASGHARLNKGELEFDDQSADIKFRTTKVATGSPLTIQAQESTGASGGSLYLDSGVGSTVSGTVYIRAGGSSTRFRANDTGVAFFSGPAVAQQTDPGALTGSPGTADGAMATVAGTSDDTNINNNFQECMDNINALRLALYNYALVA